MRLPVCALLIASLAGSLAAIEDNTQTKLTKYIDKVVETWQKYPTEKQLTVRQAAVADLTQEITKELQALDPPEGTTVQKALDHFVANLARTSAALRLEKMNSDRGQVLQVCSVAFKREIRTATDSEAETPASKIFDKMMTWSENAKTELRACGDDARAAFANAMSDASSVLMQHATKDEGDPTALYDKNLKEIRNRFPTKSPAMKKSNQAAVALLEALAKQVNVLDKKTD